MSGMYDWPQASQAKHMIDVRTLWPVDVDDDSRGSVGLLDPQCVTALVCNGFDYAVKRFIFELGVRDTKGFTFYAAQDETISDAIARIMGALGLEVSR